MDRTIRRRLAAGGIAAIVATAGVAATSTGLASGTPSSGQAAEVLAAGHLADRLKLDTKGPADVVTLRVPIDPGGTSGWHSHSGAVVVTIVSGTATFYEASRTTCDRESMAAGEVFWQNADGPSHVLVNEGGDPLVVYATFFLAPGAAPVIDQPRPPVCDGIG